MSASARRPTAPASPRVSAPAVGELLSSAILSGAAGGSGPLPEQLVRYVVAVAGAAPSVHNTQPWQFRSDGFVLDLIAERERRLRRADPDGRLLTISCGAALHHARLAARGLGRESAVAVLPEPADADLLARLAFGPRQDGIPTRAEWDLLQAVPQRRTHREAFAPGRLRRELLVDLSEIVTGEGAQLRLVERPGERQDVAELLANADRAVAADPRYQEELELWSRWEDRAGPPIVDGIPRSAVGRGPRHPAQPAFVERNLDVDGSLRAEPSPAEADLPVEVPDIAAIWTPGDTADDWLLAGAAMSALLLAATRAGVAGVPLNQPLEDPVHRTRMQEALRVPGTVQVLLKLGYVDQHAPVPAMPRRPVDDLLVR